MPVVVAAAILRGSPPRLLAARRAAPAALAGKWELPGGKVEAEEAERDALVRELAEELGVTATVGDIAAPDVPTVVVGGTLRTYWTDVEGEPQPLEHAELRWLTVDELYDVDWLAPDLPVIAAIEAVMAAT